LIVKCSECGNTFRIDTPSDEDVVVCPVCEADCKAVVKDGSVRLEAFIFEGEDLGEL
jgi:lysine biosynthesis protein LysW